MTASDTIPAVILRRVRCPRCLAPVQASPHGLRCEACGTELPVVDGVLEALGDVHADLARTIESFGYEWTTFDRIEPEDRGFWEDYYFVDVPEERLRGRVALDAGCGKGRFSRFTADHVDALVALDASDAVRSARRNLDELDNVAIVRGDLEHLPFEDGAFGFISCLGVLHHLPDPRAGFDSLVRVLEPGGSLFLYLYSRDEQAGVRRTALELATVLRRITTRVPHKALRVACAPLAAVLYALVVLPGAAGSRFGWRRLRGLPLAVYRGGPLRALWLDTFDRLSAPIEHRYVWADLEPWFAAAGLDVLSVRESAGLFVLACRPPERVQP
jgi:SAM-dependent methyltransferase